MQHDEAVIESSFRYCEKIARDHYENFPVGSLLVPKGMRKYVWAVYAFARFADDIADSEELSAEEKEDKLDKLESELDKAYDGIFDGLSEDSVKFFPALWKTRNELRIPKYEFSDLLTAFKQDAVQSRYESFSDLLEYSRYSANPIGHLVLHVFGYHPEKDKELFEYSDNICTALQLTNFWQDVSVDLKIDRIYIPLEIMEKNNYTVENLQEKIEDERFQQIIKELVGKTREIFEMGKPLINSLHGRLKLEIKATYLGGNSILNKIEKLNYKVLSERVKLSKSDTGSIFLKTLMKSI